MSEQDNQGLENFFRKAVPSPKDIEFNQSDWQKLEKNLDEKDSMAMAIAAIKRKAWISGASMMALFGLVLYFSFIGTFSINNHLEGSNKTAFAKVENSKSDTNVGPNDSSESISQNRNAEKNDITNKVVKQKPETTKVQALGRKDSEVKTDLTLKSATLNNQSESRNDNEKIAKIAGQIHMVPSLEKNQTIVLAPNNKIIPEGGPPFNQDSTKASAPVIQPKVDSADTKENKPEHEVAVTPSSWSILLSLSPDFSSSEIGEYTTPGTSGGLQIQYQLSSRWGIGTGINYSHKRYTSDASDYQMPKDFWHHHSNGIAPDEVYGSCNVVDLRIFGNYKLLQQRKNRLSISSGVSAYYFLKEWYGYQYDTPNPGAIESWNCKPSKNILATVNFSLNYEHSVSDHIAFGISPYMNLPLQRLGWSKINLHSTGVSLTMRYTFTKKK